MTVVKIEFETPEQAAAFFEVFTGAGTATEAAIKSLNVLLHHCDVWDIATIKDDECYKISASGD